MNKNDTIIFVYNANSDVFSTATDYAHKMFSPSTYECNLCKLAFHNFGMKQEWKLFVNELPFEKEFLYKDQFAKKYSMQNTFPAIYYKSGNNLQLLTSSGEINSATSLEELKSLVEKKLKAHVQHNHSSIQ